MASFFAILVISIVCSCAWASPIPHDSQQLLLGLSQDWSSSHASLQRYERNGTNWKKIGKPITSRIGKNGLAWGLGVYPSSAKEPAKVEGDGKSPAGVFEIGGFYGYQNVPPVGLKIPYHRVTEWDLWVEDPKSPFYNQHLQLPADIMRLTPWQKKQQMKQKDPAHKYKILIHHNTQPIVKGAGSAIFFHIWREDGKRAPVGCTVMSESDILELAQWFDPSLSPIFVLLPKPIYSELRKDWKLP